MVMSGELHDPAALTPGTHWIGGWVGPRAGLNTEARRRESQPLSGIEHSGLQFKTLALHVPRNQMKKMMMMMMMM
jgi:hypothetical protein